MITPPFLKKGDKIGILSTARKIDLLDLKPAVDVFNHWGLEVAIGNTIGKQDHQYAGSDEVRTADLQSFIDNDEIKAILCARGGYGTVRIIDQVQFNRFMKTPKWISGYSDATVLHSHLFTNFGTVTLHGVMASIFRFDEGGLRAQESLRKALFGEPVEYLIPRQSEFFRIGNARGLVVGGNLSILYSLLGSASDINTENKILFIEDLDEYLYHVDRMMMALKRTGKLEKLSGMIVGGMTEMNDNDVPFGKTAEEIIWEHVKEYRYPVSFNFPAGHVRDNRALYLGKEASMAVSATEMVIKYDGL